MPGLSRSQLLQRLGGAVQLLQREHRTLQSAAFTGKVGLPPNVVASLTTEPATGSTTDRNNCEAVVLRVAGSHGVMLVPGDASYTYIEGSAKQGVSLMEATHHGSKLSLLRQAGAGQGTPTDNDIPTAQHGGREVLFSTAGAAGQYHHGVALTGAFYAAKGWTAPTETTGGDQVRPI